MTQLDAFTPEQVPGFTYDCVADASSVADASGLPTRVGVFGDAPAWREEIERDLGGAGFRTVDGGVLANLLDGPITLLGDVVMVDCPWPDGAALAALTRLDMRVARAGAKLIVTTSMDALDAVFGVLDQCDPQILVEPSRGERIVAVGRVLADIGNARLREMTEDDRLNLLHLSRQVEAIAHKLDHISGHRREAGGERLGEFKRDFRGVEANPLVTATKGHNASPPPAPDPRFVRKVIAARGARAKFFDAELFADPAWDMLLDLTAAEVEKVQVSVTSLCIAAAVPATTGLRWIKQLVDTGVFVRVADPVDRRRAFIGLSESASEAMARYFAEVEVPLARTA